MVIALRNHVYISLFFLLWEKHQIIISSKSAYNNPSRPRHQDALCLFYTIISKRQIIWYCPCHLQLCNQSSTPKLVKVRDQNLLNKNCKYIIRGDMVLDVERLKQGSILFCKRPRLREQFVRKFDIGSSCWLHLISVIFTQRYSK